MYYLSPQRYAILFLSISDSISISCLYLKCTSPHISPQVDFNAGVVAAGEAQIESTVTGNTSTMTSGGKDLALKDQSQIYLPINNAITKVGHVHGFLQELGQGVQHIASRVGNIIDFIEQANNRRKIFGEVRRIFIMLWATPYVYVSAHLFHVSYLL